MSSTPPVTPRVPARAAVPWFLLGTIWWRWLLLTAVAALMSLPPAAAASESVPTRVQLVLQATQVSPAGWSWPLQPEPSVVRAFRAPAQRWAPGHRGVDLVAAPGQQVLAPADGTISFAGMVVDRGVLTITHPNGLRSSFEPVKALMGTGAAVVRGQPVAVLDPLLAHCAPLSCLHWGVRRGETYLDPLRLLHRPVPSVLLPLHEEPGWGRVQRRPSRPASLHDPV